jgi:hypothetical protein
MRLLVGDSEVIKAAEVTGAPAIARDFPQALRLVWISIENESRPHAL